MTSELKLLNKTSFLKPESIPLVEKKYNAKYLLETCIKNISGEWCNFPAAIFYAKEPHPDGSNYFALYIHPERGGLMITDGISAVKDVVFSGIDTGEGVLYSRYRHDYRTHNNCMVDGGRDYFKRNLVGAPVNFTVDKDKIVFSEYENA